LLQIPAAGGPSLGGGLSRPSQPARARRAPTPKAGVGAAQDSVRAAIGGGDGGGGSGTALADARHGAPRGSIPSTRGFTGAHARIHPLMMKMMMIHGRLDEISLKCPTKLIRFLVPCALLLSLLNPVRPEL
jgi:hypothetical protein